MQMFADFFAKVFISIHAEHKEIRRIMVAIILVAKLLNKSVWCVLLDCKTFHQKQLPELKERTYLHNVFNTKDFNNTFIKCNKIGNALALN